VPPEQRIKGFQYGPQVVPISSAELEAVKFKPEKSVKLLGFTDASNVMRYNFSFLNTTQFFQVNIWIGGNVLCRLSFQSS